MATTANNTHELVCRLREALPNVLLQREAADAIERLQCSVERLRQGIREMDREAAREVRDAVADAVAEARWQAAQNQDYGSY